MFRTSNRAARIAHRAVVSVMIIGLAAVTLGLAFSLLLSHVLVLPLRQLMGAAQRLAEGDYDVRVAPGSSDELGRLAGDFNAMAEKLKAYKKLDVRQILAEKQKSEAIIRSIDDGIVVIGTDFRIAELNPTAAATFSTTPVEARGRHVLEIIKDEKLFEHIKRAVEPGETPVPPEHDENIIAVRKDETQRYYQYSITAVRPVQETVLSIVLLLRDITRLKELDRLKSEFVMTASHELRTPLTGMEMSVELLRESTTAKLDEKERQLLSAAREEILRLKALVNDLLDISKIEAGRLEMDFDRATVEGLLEKAAAVLKSQADEKGIELSATTEPGLPPVRADVNKITWVLTNLISNALGGKGDILLFRLPCSATCL